MISIKEAAKQAADFCQQLFPNAQDILLEEVERDDNNRFWLITVSFLTTAAKRPGSSMPEGTVTGIATTLEQLFPRFERNYKILKVDAQTGEVISMKIRELQS